MTKIKHTRVTSVWTNKWTNSSFWLYAVTLIEAAPWRVALALALTLFLSVAQGAQLLLLIPLMQLVGLDVQQGSVGWLSRFVSDIFAAVGVPPTVITVLGVFLLFTIGVALLTRWQLMTNRRLEEGLVVSLRHRLYKAIANTDWLTFSRSRSSDFTHALTTEINRVGQATFFLLRLVTNSALLCVYVLLALRLSLVVTALVFVSGAALLFFLKKKTRKAYLVGEEISAVSSGLYAAAIEHLSGMKTAKSYGVEERNTDIFSKLANRVAQTHLNDTRNQAETRFWFSVGSAVILSLVLFVSLKILSVSTAGLLLLLFLFNRIIPLFNDTQQSYQMVLSALPAFAGVMRMLARCEAAAEKKTEQEVEAELSRGVVLECVSFSYGAGAKAPAIEDLDLAIEAGKTTAIVGPSGAGKSTVADLLMGLIIPSKGRMLVDGAPLSPERMRSWRGKIGYVAQDTFLFNDTVRANLLWARPEADEVEINRALGLAAAEEFVSGLPDGLETVLGDRGVRLSGGERQRLALARALLRRPSLLILDEATSALDSENERRIQDAIEELHGSTTILVIAHRLSTVRNADVIHVMEGGRLIESGDWEMLVSRKGGRFQALARTQGLPTTNS